MEPMLWVVIGGIALAVGTAMMVIASAQSDPTVGIASVITIISGLAGISKPVLDRLRKPVLGFGIVTATKNNLVGYGPRANFYAINLRLEVKKASGEGKAEQCEAFLTINDSPIRNIALRWLPDNARTYNIGGRADLLLFQLIPQSGFELVVFSAISTQGQVSTMELPYQESLPKRLKIEIHSTNAKSPKLFEKTIGEILDAIEVPS